jgi:hypothetical protein
MVKHITKNLHQLEGRKSPENPLPTTDPQGVRQHASPVQQEDRPPVRGEANTHWKNPDRPDLPLQTTQPVPTLRPIEDLTTGAADRASLLRRGYVVRKKS